MLPPAAVVLLPLLPLLMICNLYFLLKEDGQSDVWLKKICTIIIVKTSEVYTAQRSKVYEPRSKKNGSEFITK